MCVATIFFVVVVVGAAKTDLTQRFSELAVSKFSNIEQLINHFRSIRE